MAWMSASVSRGRSTLDGVKVRGDIDPNEIEDRLGWEGRRWPIGGMPPVESVRAQTTRRCRCWPRAGLRTGPRAAAISTLIERAKLNNAASSSPLGSTYVSPRRYSIAGWIGIASTRSIAVIGCGCKVSRPHCCTAASGASGTAASGASGTYGNGPWHTSRPTTLVCRKFVSSTRFCGARYGPPHSASTAPATR